MKRPSLFLALCLFAAACGNDQDDTLSSVDGGETSVCSTCGGCEERFLVKARNHVAGTISYPDPPPVGGDHNECWTDWTVHEEVVTPEHWVHNLEHGGVAFLYDPDAVDDPAALAEIKSLVERSTRGLMTSYPGLPQRFAVVAWGKRLLMDCIDVQAAAAFYSIHVGSPDAPEQSAAPPPSGCE